MWKDEKMSYIYIYPFRRENFFQCYSIKSWTKILKDHIIGVDKMIQSLDKSFRRLFVSDPKRFTFDSLSTLVDSVQLSSNFRCSIFRKKGRNFTFFCNNFQPWAEKLKEKIPSVRRNFTFSPGWKKIVPIVHPCIVQHHARLEILKFTATDARVARTSPRFRSTLLASFFLSFFLAVFFLTFWNRHGAERGSLTKVGNHTHRFHAMPHSSTGWPSWTGPRTLAPVSLE